MAGPACCRQARENCAPHKKNSEKAPLALFEIEQEALGGEAEIARIAAQLGCSDNPVTGNDDGDRVLPTGRSDRPGTGVILLLEKCRKIAIAPRLAIGNPQKRLPDAALERRFQPVTVEEPSIDETIEILIGVRPLYEEHHRLKISDEALKAAANLAARYVTDRFMPDKAIDLIDEAASRVRMQKSVAPPTLKDALAGLSSLQRELEAAVESQEFEIAAELRDRERKLRDRIEDQEQELRDQQAEEDGNIVFDRQYGALYDTYRRQNVVHQLGGLVAPLLAVRVWRAWRRGVYDRLLPSVREPVRGAA